MSDDLALCYTRVAWDDGEEDTGAVGGDACAGAGEPNGFGNVRDAAVEHVQLAEDV